MPSLSHLARALITSIAVLTTAIPQSVIAALDIYRNADSGFIEISQSARVNGNLTTTGNLTITGGYLDYRPAGIACNGGQILSWSGSVNRWLCDDNAPGITGSGLTTNYVTKWNGSLLVNSLLFSTSTGVGIGTTSPSQQLHISGAMKSNGVFNTDSTAFTFRNEGGSWLPIQSSGLNIGDFTSPSSSYGVINIGAYNFSLRRDDNSNIIYATNSGNVGIGTTAPGYTLDVSGSLRVGTGTDFTLSGRYLSYKPAGAACSNGQILSWDNTNSRWVCANDAGSGTTIAGTTNYVARFTAPTTIGTGSIFDDGTNVSIGSSSSLARLYVNGSTRLDLGSDATGDIFYRGAGGNLTRLALGSSGQILTATTGAPVWQAISATGGAFSGTFWGLDGNNPSATDFLGTLNNEDLRIYTNNTQRMVVGSGGNVGIGTGNLSSAMLSVAGDISATGRFESPNSTYYFDATNGLANFTNAYFSNWYGSDSVLRMVAAGGVTYFPTTAGNIGIGTTSPGQKLTVSGGTIQIIDGTEGSGKILASDASGVASWQTPASYLSGSFPVISVFGRTGAVVAVSGDYTASQITNVPAGSIASTDVQSALNELDSEKQALITGAATTITSSNLTASRALASDASGKVSVATTTLTELNTLTGVTGNVQSQLDQKAPLASPLFTGDPRAPTPATSDNDTSIATTAYVKAQSYLTGETDPEVGSNTTNALSKWNGSALIASRVFDDGTYVGVGTASPSTHLTVSGSALVTGDITVQGRVITDTIINRTVTNVTISGSILPDSAAPLVYRDIGSTTQRWNNLYLSGQVTIGGGSPGAGKILTSDATGLASWQTPGATLSGTFWSLTGNTVGASDFIGSTNNADLKIYTNNTERMVVGSGGNIGIGTSNPSHAFELSGANKEMVLTGGNNSVILNRPNATTNLNILFRQGGAERWGITSTGNNLDIMNTNVVGNLFLRPVGNVGINTTAPGYTLDVSGSLRVGTGTDFAYSGRYLSYRPNGTACANGQILAWNNTSSRWECGNNSQGVTGTGSDKALAKWSLSGGTLVLSGSSEVFESGGRIGINTSDPQAQLHVIGTTYLTGGYLDYRPNGSTCSSGQILSWSGTISAWTCGNDSNGVVGGQSNYIARWTSATSIGTGKIYDNNTNVGINTILPGYTLDVSGSLRVGTGTDFAYSGRYLSYKPAGTACTNGQILAWDNTNSRWQCASDSQGVTGTGIANAVTKWILSGSTLVLSGSTVMSESGGYLNYRPAGTACTNGQILSWDNTNSRWICGTDSQGVSGTGSDKALAKWSLSGGVLVLSGSSEVFESGGRIGINTNNPLAQLHVIGTTYLTGGNLGIQTTSPLYGVDIRGNGSGGMLNTQSGICINGTCVQTWSGVAGFVQSTGNPNYLAKFSNTGVLSNSQLYESGSKLFIGDVAAILGGSATSSYGYITIETFGSTNSSNPFLTLSENGGQECRLWMNGANKIGSNCAWTAGVSGYTFTANNVVKADSTGNDYTGSLMYSTNTGVGINVTNPAYTLEVSGSLRVGTGTDLAYSGGYLSYKPGLSSCTNGQILSWDGTNGRWICAHDTGSGTSINGTTNYIARFTNATTIGTGSIFDTGTGVGIGTTAMAGLLDIRRASSDGGVILRLGDNGSTTTNFDFIRDSTSGALKIQGNQTGNNNISLAPTSGNVGIGTASPGVKLEVNGSIRGNTSGAVVIDSGNGTLTLGAQNASYAHIYTDRPSFYMNNPLGFGTGSSPVSQIHNSTGNSYLNAAGGNVGIGTSSPGTALDIRGLAPVLTIGTTGNTGGIIYLGNSSHGLQRGYNGGANDVGLYTTSGDTYLSANGVSNSQFVLKNAGNVGIGTSSPNARLEASGGTAMTAGWNRTAMLTAQYPVLMFNSNNTKWAGIGYDHTSNFNFWVNSASNDIGGGTLGLSISQAGNVGIGSGPSASAKMYVAGSGVITGDLTVQGSVITDRIVNRTVTNVTVSGSILPDSAAPASYRDIGSDSLKWNNLYLGGQIKIAGGSPGANKVLTSDAAGLATWQTVTGLFTESDPQVGVNTTNYVPKWDGSALVTGQIFDSGTGVGFGMAAPTEMITLNGTDIDFTRGDTSAIHSLGEMSFDWTAGSYDLAANHGIQSKDENGSFADALRINSYGDIINTIDSNANGTNTFKVQKESTGNGTDLFTVSEAGTGYLLGNLGIGTTTPTYKLDVAGLGGSNIDLRTTGRIAAGSAGAGGIWVDGGSNQFFGSLGASDMGIYNAGWHLVVNSSGNVGIGTSTLTQKLTITGGLASVNGQLLAEASTDNLLVNGDFEMARLDGWGSSPVASIVAAGSASRAGNYVSQFTGNSSVESVDYIPVDPVRDVLQLEGYFKKTVAGGTPGVLYFGYIAYDQNKTAITTAPCGTYCYFAAAGAVLPADGSWHKFASTTTGEGTAFPSFPVGTRYVRVLGLINYGASADAVTQMDHVTLKRITSGPLFAGNNFSSTNMSDQYQSSQIYTDSSNRMIVVTPSNGNVGINVTSPSAKLDVYAANDTSGVQVNNSAGHTAGIGVDAAATYWGSSIFQDGTKRFTVESNGGILVGGGYQSSNAPANGAIIEGNVGIGTASPTAKLTIGNNVAAGYLDNYSEYQQILYDGGTAGGSYGFGIKGSTVVLNSGGGAYSFDRGGSATSMAIDTSGNVGIGTTSPGGPLDVNGRASATSLKVGSTFGDLTNNAPWYGIGMSNLTLPSGSSTAVQIGGYYGINFATAGGTSTMVINQSGNVGIGTDAPATKLEVAGQVKITGGSPGAGKVLTSDASGLATWATPINGTSITGVTNMTPVFKVNLFSRGDAPARTTSTSFQTLRYVYGPFSYAQPSCPAGTTKQYKVYAEFVDNITSGGQTAKLRIALDGGTNIDFDMGYTWGGSPNYRNYLSNFFSTSDTNHAQIQIRIAGTAGPYIELHNAEIWMYCTQ